MSPSTERRAAASSPKTKRSAQPAPAKKAHKRPARPGAAAARPAARVAPPPTPTPARPPPPALKLRDVGQKLGAIEPKWASAPRPSAPRAAPSLERLLEQLRSADAAVRESAAGALGERREDSEKAVRSAAAISLARLGDRALLAEMVKGLSDSNPRSVAGSAVALGLSKRPEVVEPLLAAFKTHNTSVGAAVAGALGMIRDARALPPLLEALKADFVPADACDALGALGDARAAPGLTRALKHRDEKVRARAARALGALRSGLAAADCREARDKAVLALRKLLADPSRKLRLSAALSLHELGDREASAQIVAVLRGA